MEDPSHTYGIETKTQRQTDYSLGTIPSTGSGHDWGAGNGQEK